MGLRSIGLVAILVMVAAACGDSSTDTTGAAASSNVRATDTVVDVTYDGQGCTVSAPELPIGDYSFVLTNESQRESTPLYVVQLVDGHTYQELVDMQAAIGGPPTFMPMPEWAVFALRSFGAPALDLADNQELYAFSLDEGEHAVYVRIENPSAIHLCDQLDVVPS